MPNRKYKIQDSHRIWYVTTRMSICEYAEHIAPTYPMRRGYSRTITKERGGVCIRVLDTKGRPFSGCFITVVDAAELNRRRLVRQ